MTRRSSTLSRGRLVSIRRMGRIPRWLILVFLVFMCLTIAAGIYIGLHARVLGPGY